MKASFTNLFIPVFFISILFLLQSCGHENMVTQPPEKPTEKAPMAKTTATTVINDSSLSNSTDTLITLPKSKKSILVSKNLPADKLALIDKYLFSHKKIPFKNTVTPNAMLCNYYNEYTYVYANQYQPADGKYIGIWTNYLSYYQCHLFGFNQYFVDIQPTIEQFNTAIQTAIDSGFNSNNVMASLGWDSTFVTDYLDGTPKDIGNYYIDEPDEQGIYTTDQVGNFCVKLANKRPNCKLQLSAYRPTYAELYYTVLCNDHSNIGIMCDQYHGDCYGYTYQYWQTYKSVFGTHNTMNFMDIVINNGNGHKAGLCPGSATSWQTLMTTADDIGINNIWLYANNTGDEAAVLNFCYQAWGVGWMKRLKERQVVCWKCTTPAPCERLIFPPYNIQIVKQLI